MQLRRTPGSRTAGLAAGTLLATVLLSACDITGMNAATNREYTPAAGANARDAAVDVLGAVIVSDQAGSGTFVATFVNNSATSAATVDSLTAAAGTPELKVGEFSSIDVPARGLVNLADDDQGIAVTGDFEAGRFVRVTIGLGDADQVTLNVPVVPDDHEFDGLDQTA